MVQIKDLTMYPHTVESLKKPEEGDEDHLDQHIQINRLLFALQATYMQLSKGIESLETDLKLSTSLIKHIGERTEEGVNNVKSIIAKVKELIPKEKPVKPHMHLDEIKKGVAMCVEGQLSSSRVISHGIGFDGRKFVTQAHEISVQCNKHVKSYIIDPPSISDGKVDVSITVLGDGIGKAVVEYEVKILSYTID